MWPDGGPGPVRAELTRRMDRLFWGLPQAPNHWIRLWLQQFRPSRRDRPVGTGRRRAAAHHSKPSCVCRCRKRGEPQGGGRGKRNEPEEGAVPLSSSAPWLPAVSHEHGVTRGQGALAPAPSEPGPTEGEQLRSGDSAAALCGQRSPRTRLGPGSVGKPRSPQEYQLHFSKAFFS